MNSNNENESQNVNIEQNENINQQNNQRRNKNRKKIKTNIIYLNFMFLFSLNLSLYLYWKYYYIRISYFSISLYPILNKYQLYRFITHHFMHYGICHFFVEIVITFYLCKFIEKIIGTLLTFSLILIMIITTSFLFFMVLLMYKLTALLFNLRYEHDFIYECGMSSLLFALYTYINIFEKNKNKVIKILNIVSIKTRYSQYYILLFLSIFTPNRTFFGNVIGIISGYIIKNLFGYRVFPKYEGIIDFEEFLHLNAFKCCYISIIDSNQEMKTYLKEIYYNMDLNSSEIKQVGSGIQMEEIENPSINIHEVIENNNENNDKNNNEENIDQTKNKDDDKENNTLES